jgi:hypothetical protein
MSSKEKERFLYGIVGVIFRECGIVLSHFQVTCQGALADEQPTFGKVLASCDRPYTIALRQNLWLAFLYSLPAYQRNVASGKSKRSDIDPV